MKTLLLLIGVIILYVTFWGILLAIPKPDKVLVDCGMASFHPDYTNEMRKACNERFIKK